MGCKIISSQIHHGETCNSLHGAWGQQVRVRKACLPLACHCQVHKGPTPHPVPYRTSPFSSNIILLKSLTLVCSQSVLQSSTDSGLEQEYLALLTVTGLLVQDIHARWECQSAGCSSLGLSSAHCLCWLLAVLSFTQHRSISSVNAVFSLHAHKVSASQWLSSAMHNSHCLSTPRRCMSKISHEQQNP